MDYAESSRLKSLLNCRGAKEETPEGGNDVRCPKQITAEMIPEGDDLETIKQRSKLLKEFYDWWFLNHPERKIHNNALDEDICVTYLSKHETSGQAARRYKSTLAVLKLDYILENAVPILSDPADKNTKAQKKFEKMLLMKCKCEDQSIVKLTVGVYKDTSHKEQYCITVIEADPKDSFKQSKKHGSGKKKKTNRHKKPAR